MTIFERYYTKNAEMYYTLSIPEPCTENWHTMSPGDGGRHCDKCCKTVIDFTDWEPCEVLFYLQANKNVCGHISAGMVDVPIFQPDEFVQYIDSTPLSLMKKIAAIFLFVFCIMSASCNNKPDSNRNTLTGDTTAISTPPPQNISAKKDSLHFDGAISIKIPDSTYNIPGDNK